MLLDLSAAHIGDAIVLETREFDPMHFDAPAAPRRAEPIGARAFARDAMLRRSSDANAAALRRGPKGARAGC